MPYLTHPVAIRPFLSRIPTARTSLFRDPTSKVNSGRTPSRTTSKQLALDRAYKGALHAPRAPQSAPAVPSRHRRSFGRYAPIEPRVARVPDTAYRVRPGGMHTVRSKNRGGTLDRDEPGPIWFGPRDQVLALHGTRAISTEQHHVNEQGHRMGRYTARAVARGRQHRAARGGTYRR